jgi:cytochrome c2
MRTKLFSGMILLAGLMALSTGLASAGGWSAVKLETLPRVIVINEQLTIRYAVLQHGAKPVAGLETKVVATHTESKMRLTVNGQPAKYPNSDTYLAELIFPKAGGWHWVIEAFEGQHPMPPLTVSPAGMGTSSRISQPIWMVVASIMVAVGVVLIGWRRRPRLFASLAVLVLALGVGSYTFASPKDEVSKALPGNDMYVSEADYGAALFLAKGCASCHVHSRNDYTVVQDSFGYVGAYNTGPDLTDFHADSDFLSRWLSSPKSIRPKTGMPDLNLSEAEIAALIAFLNQK